ncbi:hypothetical protein DMB66_24485 [Actinoplanes sp. ATCC 53533]|uniref:nSTAND3 domain-containing NTPase n=1 Tax=Actinoplanes sp. ATCC 53533 TaxID=1288362 RepID=UPI000F7A7339|nr:restriction endonuclease [Actinoplanes sp. ATCC 53533]RSM61585.1 hypothetical protein DMB66_24485 [Actinoplanes sp. ATCC 53533]
MDEVDITRLSDFDFERLCEDLFGEILGTRLEIFAPGPDGGVDLRHMSSDGDIIIQCKHWYRSGRAALVRHMKNSEASKVRRLKPSRYILATSADLNDDAKKKLVRDLSPYLREADIYGVNEIVAELGRRPRLVARHIRLWLSGASVLQALLNKRTLTRSSRLHRNLKKTLEVYAPNTAFIEAKRLLETRNICVISGLPGIGKTTLARVLCADYVRDGFDLYDVSDDVDEINASWDDEAKQIFYYDDFLGQTALGDKLGKNEDVRLIDLLKDVSSSENKRIILTTRGYILEQARQIYERLERFDFRPNTFILDLEDYRDSVRAAILYNHVHFSRLSPRCKAAFAHPDVYLDVIRHRNYNPRLIENTIDVAVRNELTPANTVALLRHNLSNPGEVWHPIFRNQLPTQAAEILETLLFLGDGTELSDVALAWRAYSSRPAREVNDSTFMDAVKILDQIMIQAGSGSASRVYFTNASVADYLKAHVTNAAATYVRIIRTATFFEQIERAWIFAQESSALRLILCHHSNDVRDAIDRTLLVAAPNHRAIEVIRRVNVALAISQACSISDLTEDIQHVLATTGLTNSINDFEEALELTLRCKRSESKQLRQIASSMAEKIAAEVTADMNDWSSADRAVSVISQLYGLPGYEQLEAAEFAKEQAAKSTIAAVSASGLGPVYGVTRQELTDILDYADQWDDPTGFSPYLDDLRDSLAIIEMEDQREAEFVDWYSASIHR